jgi:hypothetical protein
MNVYKENLSVWIALEMGTGILLGKNRRRRFYQRPISKRCSQNAVFEGRYSILFCPLDE